MADRFTRCIELLLQGEVLCEVGQPELYRYLTEEHGETGNTPHKERVAEFLSQLGRTLTQTSDQAGFYCTLSSGVEPEELRQARAWFDEAVTHFEPLIDFLRMEREAKADPRPLSAGDVLKLSDLEGSVADSESLNRQLHQLVGKLKVARQASTSRDELKAVIAYLVREGYLKEVGSSGVVYRATAKWSLFYDLLEFVRSVEGFADESVDPAAAGPVQTELF